MLRYHIQTIEVGSGGASNLTFTNIPQIYSDLLLVVSARTGDTGGAVIKIKPNNIDGTSRFLRGNPSIGVSSSTYSFIGARTASGDRTAGVFGSTSFYISNYSSSSLTKPISMEGVEENRSSDLYLDLSAGYWPYASAINSLVVVDGSGTNIAQYSSATLYGIKRGSDGVTKTAPVATGGTVTSSGGYTIHTFTGSGTFNLLNTATVDYLVVAGGGSGGATTSNVDYNTGAGGAGGYRYLTSQALSAGSYSVVVGGGGSIEGTGTPGSNSSFASTSATGGGAGGSGGGNYIQPTSGGSGGGGGTPGTLTAGTGNAGGYSPVEGYSGGNGNSGGAGSTSGGGGGAGGAGGTPTAGPGAANSITGSSVTYATGGTGLSGGGTGSASNAAANTGNGGNAGRSQRFVSGLGGSGIVIIRYLTP